MSITKRNLCRLCTSNRIEVMLKLLPIPLSENYSNSREESLSQTRYDLEISQCLDCGHVQLVNVIDTELLWNSYSYYSKNSHGMSQHFETIASLIEKYKPQNLFEKNLVVDIGSNDGTFLKIMQQKGYEIIGIDPAKEVANYAIGNGVPTIISVLSDEVATRVIDDYGQADIVTAFNVFAHTDDLIGFISAVGKMLKPGGLFVFEAQYLRDILEQDLIATFFHEHMSHHSLSPLIGFLKSNNLNLFHAERFKIQHGSIVGLCIKGNSTMYTESLEKLLDEEASLDINSISAMKNFGDRFKKNVTLINEFLEKSKSAGMQIVGYGAARSAPTLIIQFGLGNLIDFVVDDDENKIGKYETGAGLEIFSPKAISNPSNTIAVVLAWVQLQKIIESNSNFLDQGGKFLVLSPKPHVISKTGIVEFTEQ